jgi:hypothetical protein
MKTSSLLAFAVAVAASVGAAHAGTFNGSAVGSWSNVQGTSQGDVYSISNSDAGGVASFVFGVGSGTPANSFTFNGVGSDGGAGFSADAEQSFDIGHFTYYNGSTYNYPQESSVDLGLALTLTSPIANTSTFSYNFGIDITPNTTGNPVLDGDIVTITDGLTSTTFTVGDTIYTLALNGFSTDGGQTFTSQFLSPEETTANADIYATITTNLVSVPEPSTMGLVAMALACLTLLGRRRGALG